MGATRSKAGQGGRGRYRVGRATRGGGEPVRVVTRRGDKCQAVMTPGSRDTEVGAFVDVIVNSVAVAHFSGCCPLPLRAY
jgi:hypothetical protein